MEIDYFTKADIETDFRRIDVLLSSGIFEPHSTAGKFRRAAFIELLICLRDLMAKTEKYASRISFSDDVVITDKIKDISDLVKFVRDALCHPEIEHHFLIPGKVKATYNIVFGKGELPPIKGITVTSDYEDDICFFFGVNKIYLNRHITRALIEARQKLTPLL